MNLPDALQNIENIDDLVDQLLSPIKDYTDTLEDLAQPIKGLTAIYHLRKKLQLKSFIKGYNQAFKNHQVTTEDKYKLVKYLEKEENLLLVSEILESAMSSISIKSSSLLGVIAGGILSNKSESLAHSDYILIGALRNLTDQDLDLFKKLIEFVENVNPPSRRVENDSFEFKFHYIYKEMNNEKIPFERSQIETLVEKLKNLGVLSYSSGGTGRFGNDRGAFMTSEYSGKLYELIQQNLMFN